MVRLRGTDGPRTTLLIIIAASLITAPLILSIPVNASGDGIGGNSSSVAVGSEGTGVASDSNSAVTDAETTVSVSRDIGTQTLSPGESTEITIDASLNETQNFQIIETVDSNLSVEVVDGPGNVVGNQVTYNFVEALGTATNETTVRYRVTVPENASDGEIYEFDGVIDTGTKTTIDGETTLTIDASNVSATRSIASPSLSPGESTEVTIDVAFEQTEQFQIVETVDSNLSVEVVDGPGNVAGNQITYNFVEALGTATNETTVRYRVTVPENATDGESYQVDGWVTAETETIIEGADTITVDAVPTPADFANETGIVDDAGLNDAVRTYLQGELPDETLNEVVRLYLTGESIS